MTRNLEAQLLKIKEGLEAVELDFKRKEIYIEEKSYKFTSIDKIIEDSIFYNDYVIRLNIGGKIFTTRLSLLAENKDTLFYSIIFKYAESRNFPKEIFIDRNYTHFPVILEYIRYKKISLSKFNTKDKEEIKKELEFYGIDLYSKSKKSIELEWDQTASKAGACTVDLLVRQRIQIHTTTCYTHFITNKVFTNENFVVEFISNVSQSDNYFYFGLINEFYNTTSSCCCCNPQNAFYLQKDGSFHNSGSRTNTNLMWSGSDRNLIIGMRVLLSEKTIYFYRDSPENEIGPYVIACGNSFRVFAGHCNSGNGEIEITECYSLGII